MLDIPDDDTAAHISQALADAGFAPVELPAWASMLGAMTRPVGRATIVLMRPDGGPFNDWTAPVRVLISRPPGSLLPKPAKVDFPHLAHALHFVAVLAATFDAAREVADAAA